MIAKINFDGKEHMAIVFNEYVDFSELLGYKKALNECIKIANMQEDAHLDENNTCYCHTLLSEMELSENQLFEMFVHYFGGRNWTRPAQPSTKKAAEIYI